MKTARSGFSSIHLCILTLQLGAPRRDNKDVLKEYDKAKDLLGTRNHSKKIKLIEENEADDFANEIAPKIEADSSHEKKKK